MSFVYTASSTFDQVPLVNTQHILSTYMVAHNVSRYMQWYTCDTQ